MSNTKIRKLLIISGLIVMTLIGGLLIYNGRHKDYNERIVGFIMNGRIEESGWNSGQYAGIKEVCDELGIKLLVRENIEEGSGMCKDAIEEFINRGAGAIVLLSYDYVLEAKDVIDAHKDVIFYTTNAEVEGDNIVPFFSRLYQARYLSGIIAGMTTKTDRIGYVAAVDNSEVNRGINAFALGVQRVNKDAEVIVKRTGSWENEEAEVKAADDLIDKAGVDVLTCHQNMWYSIREADNRGIYTIGYHAVPDDVSDKLLTMVECDWSVIYNIILSEYCKGTSGRQRHYWIGLEKNAVGLSPYSVHVTKAMAGEVEKARAEIVEGRDVFSGVIFDNEGELRCMRGETMTDDNILNNVDWLVKGVREYED